ncbi:MAG: hypothetical protein R3C49_22200 [Planctomycetaceae bacterium]
MPSAIPFASLFSVVAIAVLVVSIDEFNRDSSLLQVPGADADLVRDAAVFGDELPFAVTDFSALHQEHTAAFVNEEGFGISRIPRFERPLRNLLAIDGNPHTIDRKLLIGLMDDAKVYVANWQGKPKLLLKASEHRDLTDLERLAVDLLESGQSVVWVPDLVDARHAATAAGSGGTSGTIIAGLRAGAECRECHDVSEGALLGAFSYHMTAFDPSALRVPAELQLQAASVSNR